LAVFLFLASVLGGWRATVYIIAILTTLMVMLMAFAAGFAGFVFDGLAVFRTGFAVPAGTLGDALPGVIQFSSGIGRELPAGGLWTTTAVLSFALAAAGAALSPSFSFLGLTVNSRSSFAFSQVWITSGLAAGALILLGPLIAGEMGPNDRFAALVAKFAVHDQLAAVCLVAMLIAALLIAVIFFMASGANIASIELLDRYVLPSLTPRGKRLTARITLAVIYAVAAILAIFFPAAGAVLSALALPLSAQLFPAYLGLCWLPWMSRSAVLVGLILGSLFVVFTEPAGLILFDAAFVQLPWGRWPLTIHSAAWGLAVNIAASLLVAIFTRKGTERDHRNTLHAIFLRDHGMNFGGRAARGAKWSITLLWAFFALGPGAILGNTFFSHPMFSGAKVALGVPSLWVWQTAFWIIGVMIVWWLAYHSRLSIIETSRLRLGELREAHGAIGEGRQPTWIALLVARLAALQHPTGLQERRLK